MKRMHITTKVKFIVLFAKRLSIYSKITIKIFPGWSLFNMERFEEAIECYDKVIQLKPEHADAFNVFTYIFENYLMI